MLRHVYFHKSSYHPNTFSYGTIRTIAEYDKAFLRHIEVGYIFFTDHLLLFRCYEYSGVPNLDCEIVFDDPFFLPNLVDRYKEHIKVGNVIGDIAIRDMIIKEVEDELSSQC